SDRERLAVEAERDTTALKQAQFMLDKIGEEFEGIVSSVTNFGLFVELDNTIEGLVHVSYMVDDYYRFDDRQMMMIGEHTGKQFRIGDEVEVRVASVKPEESAIDFELVGMKKSFHRPRREAPKVIQTRRGGGDRDRSRNGSGKGRGQSEGTSEGQRKRKRRNEKKKFYEGVAKKSGRKSRKRR